MKKRNNILALGVLAALFFAACKKNDNGPELSPKEKILTSTVWKLKTLTIPQADDPTKDVSIALPCSEKASMVLDKYKAFQIANPSQECDSTIVPYDRGKWTLNGSNDTLFLEGKRKLAWKILVLNADTLKATFRDSIAPDKDWVKTITLEK